MPFFDAKNSHKDMICSDLMQMKLTITSSCSTEYTTIHFLQSFLLPATKI